MHARRVIWLASLLGGVLLLPYAWPQRGGGLRRRFSSGPAPGDMDRHGPPFAGPPGPIHGGLQLGPPGRWWDDKHFVKDLKLRPDQQRRMDSIFEEIRPTLFHRLETLHSEEDRMQFLVHSHPVDENALYMQIDRVEEARADLEKASAHYLLQIRSEMDANQISKLDKHAYDKP